jgi:hypothetical protein
MKKTGKIGGLFKALALIVFVWGVVCLNLYGDEHIINISASVDASEIGLKDTLTLTVTVEAENIIKIPKPEIPEMKHFTIINESSSTQSKISVIKNETIRRKTITYAYQLKPLEKGTFTIEPISIQYRGIKYKTDPITIKVYEGEARQKKESVILDDGTIIDPEALNKEIFLIVQPEKSRVYQNEQVFLIYKLYSTLDIDAISLKQNPAFPGFYIEEIYNATRLEYKKEQYAGNLYTSSLIKKVVLFPLSPGHFSPSPIVLEATVILKSKDILDIYGRPFTMTIKSNDVLIEVQSLPRRSEERDFSGIVGELSINVSTPVYTGTTGESLTCYLTMKSTGNLNLITDPGIITSKRARVYLSDTMMDRIEGREAIYFVKKFEYTLIPEESGKLEIKSPEIIYFSPEKQTYMISSSDPVVLTITGENITREKPLKDEKRSSQAGSLQFIKRNVKSLKSTRASPLEGIFFYLYHILLVAGTAFAFIFIMKKERLEKNIDLIRMRRAYASSMELLAKADRAIEEQHYDKAVDFIHKSITSYLVDKLALKLQDISLKNIRNILDNFTWVKDTTKESFISVFEECMRMKFSMPQLEDRQLIQELRSKSSMIIESMESSEAKNTH